MPILLFPAEMLRKAPFDWETALTPPRRCCGVHEPSVPAAAVRAVVRQRGAAGGVRRRRMRRRRRRRLGGFQDSLLCLVFAPSSQQSVRPPLRAGLHCASVRHQVSVRRPEQSCSSRCCCGLQPGWDPLCVCECVCACVRLVEHPHPRRLWRCVCVCVCVCVNCINL